MPILTEKQHEVVSALVFSSMNVAEASRMLGCHRNTVLWHIAKIQEKTKLDPLDFFDLHDLFNMTEDQTDAET